MTVSESNDSEDSVYHFKINEMIIGDNRLPVEPSQITVLIGSNNVGKSRLLKEIRSGVLGGPNEVGTNAPLQPILLNEISFNLPSSYDELEKSYGISNRVKRGRDGNYRIDAFCDTGIYIEKTLSAETIAGQPILMTGRVALSIVYSISLSVSPP